MFKAVIRKSAESAVQYFIKADSLSESEKSGMWIGQGCQFVHLKQNQSVTSGNLKQLLFGHNANDQLIIPKNSAQKTNRRVGFETIISSSKSISIAGLCLDNEIKKPVISAYNNAVSSLHNSMECFTSRQFGREKKRINTYNLTSAVFNHETSRFQDPLLHSHILSMNFTYDLTQKSPRFAAVEPSPFFHFSNFFDRYFNRELHRNLNKNNIDSSLDDKGRCHVNIPQKICYKYSKAHFNIQDAIEENRDYGYKTQNKQTLANLINDKERPEKPVTPNWDDVLSPGEKQECETAFTSKSVVSFPVNPLDKNKTHKELRKQIRSETFLPNTGTILNAVLNNSLDDETIGIEGDEFLEVITDFKASDCLPDIVDSFDPNLQKPILDNLNETFEIHANHNERMRVINQKNITEPIIPNNLFDTYFEFTQSTETPSIEDIPDDQITI